MFAVRQIVINGVRPLVPGARRISGKAGSLVQLVVDQEGFAVLTLQRPPVNSLNLELLQNLSKALDEVAASKVKGMILTSASPTVFSAGLDLLEMYKPDIRRAEVMLRTMQDVWIKLFGSDFITAAAINGHAPAGGCMLALSCEYRAMVGGTIGMNETLLGMVLSRLFMDTMRHTISDREAEFAINTGRMFNVDEALKAGLIDDKAVDKADAVEKCKEFIKRFDRIPPLARALTKQRVREAPLRRLHENRQQDIDTLLKALMDPNVQKAMGMYLENLKKQKQKSKTE